MASNRMIGREIPLPVDPPPPPLISVAHFMHQLNAVLTLVNLLEGTCRQWHLLRRYASLVLRDMADLDLLITRLDVAETDEALVDTFRKQIATLHDQASVYL